MKKLKPFVVGSLLAAFIIATPAMSFADNSNKNENDNQTKKVKVNHSLKNKISNLFNNRVSAETNNLSPIINGITAPTVLKIGEVGTWTVKASDPQNGSLSYSVNWGDTSILPIARMSQSTIVQNSTFTHNYSNKGNYKVTFTVSNSAGLKTISTVTVHVSAINQTLNAPVISNLVVTSTKSNKATISWVTDVRANNLVWYSKTSPVNTSVKPNVSRHDNKNLKHKIELKKLEPNTKYYVVVGSTNRAGTTKSSEISFITPAKTNNREAPVISLIETKTEDSTSTISWTTNELATSGIFYSKITPLDVNSNTTVSIVDNTLATKHSLNIPGLAKSTLYHFIVKSTDASNNTVTSSESAFMTNSEM